MKRTFVLLAALFLGTSAMAQHELGAGLEAGLPMGTWGDMHSFGIGASIKYAYNFGEASAVTGTVGYISFSPKSDFKDAGMKATGYIPFRVGYRHSFSGFYVEPQVGFASATLKAGGASASRSGLSYAFNAGYRVSKFDISARYEGMSQKDLDNPAFIGFRVGYTFLGGDKE